MKFTISGIPMPPSANAQYWAQSIRGRDGKSFGKICPSNDLNKYKKDFASWQLSNLAAVQGAREFCKKMMSQGYMLDVETYACFPYSKLWTIKGMPKILDASNRLKALHDCLAEMLSIDDSKFWKVSVEKLETKQPDPWCFVVFKPHDPKGVGTKKWEIG